MKAIHKFLSLIHNFITLQLSMMQTAETFLVKCLKPTIDLDTFDVLHLTVFNGNALKMDIERTPFTSINTRKHKEHISNNSCGYKSSLEIKLFGFVRKGNSIVPDIVISKPEGLPDPCMCSKCAHKNGCCWRVAGIKCCKYSINKGGYCCKRLITE